MTKYEAITKVYLHIRNQVSIAASQLTDHSMNVSVGLCA